MSFKTLSVCSVMFPLAWLFTSCRPAPPPPLPTSTSTTAATASGQGPLGGRVTQNQQQFDETDPFRPPPLVPAPIPISEDELPASLPEVIVTWIALGPNVFLETVREPVDAVAALLADRAARLGEAIGTMETWTSVPRQLVMHQRRDLSLGRRVILTGRICTMTGAEITLEHLLTCFHAGKDHESVISAPFDAQHLHIALLAAGLKPGKPASFVNEKQEFDYKPATGDKVRVLVQYQAKDRLVTHRGQRWVKKWDTGEELKYDWVFAGSTLWPDAEAQRPPWYGGNEGRVICVANFLNAVLDVPFSSPDVDPTTGGLLFRANARLIPPMNTPVTVILEQVKVTK